MIYGHGSASTFIRAIYKYKCIKRICFLKKLFVPSCWASSWADSTLQGLCLQSPVSYLDHLPLHVSLALSVHGSSKDCKPTFLPPPDCDCMFWIDSYWHEKLASSTEINIVHSFRMEATQHRQSLLSHGIPYVDRRRCAWIVLKKRGLERCYLKLWILGDG